MSSNTELLKKIITIWKAEFSYDKEINEHSDFFELGGDSLKAILIINHIHRITGYQLGIDEFHRYRSPFQLCEYLNDVAIPQS